MTETPDGPRLLDDCFLHDSDRMRHNDVVALLLDRLTCVSGVETVPLEHAHDRVAADNIEAPRKVPLHENAAVDGYAFDHGSYLESGGRMRPAERMTAGDTRLVRISVGECARIFTGAVMPEGTDTVVMQEDCTTDSGLVLIPSGLKPGANCRHAGEDLARGDLVIGAGQVLRSQDIAALASLGVDEVTVRRRLRAAVMSTGNELVAPGGTIRHGEVFDSNAVMLKTMIEAAGGTVTSHNILPDDRQAIEQALAAASACHDLVITSGGASRGEEDHMLAALDTLGKRHMWQIAIKPGRPMMFGQIGDCVINGLPGNPVAAFVCFLLYVRPAMLRLNGAFYREPTRYPLPAMFDLANKKTGRREYLRGILKTDEGQNLSVDKYSRDGSGLISGLRAADGLIELDEDMKAVERGGTVSFIPFSEFGVL